MRIFEPMFGAEYVEANRELIERKLELVRRFELQEQRILDVGCSVGILEEQLLRRNEVHGLDCRTELLQAAARKGYRIHEVDLLREPLPFADAELDVVLLFDILEHVARPDRLLGEAHRVLHPGGLLLVSAPNSVNIVNRALTLLGDVRDFTDSGHRLGQPFSDHLQRLALRPVCRLLSDEGFDVREVHSYLMRRIHHPHLVRLQPLLDLVNLLRLVRWFPGLFAFAFLIACRAR